MVAGFTAKEPGLPAIPSAPRELDVEEAADIVEIESVFVAGFMDLRDVVARVLGSVREIGHWIGGGQAQAVGFRLRIEARCKVR